jgi:hypothetical protein
MIDRWTSEAGIQAPKGWSFQVRLPCIVCLALTLSPQFSSESHVYFKSEQMHGEPCIRRLSRHLHFRLHQTWMSISVTSILRSWVRLRIVLANLPATHTQVPDREIEIIQSLLEQVCVYQKEIADACDTCAELDCLLSFATASREYDYHRPTMVENNIIDIIGGRSVLLPSSLVYTGFNISD